MKKNKIILGIAITILTVIISSTFNWNSSKGNLLEVTNDELMASNLAAEAEVPQTVSDEPESRFFYNIKTRYNAIKKSDVAKAISINDFLNQKQMPPLNSYQSVSIIIVKDNKQTNNISLSKDGKLSNSQIELLKSADYSTNFLVRANYEKISEETLQSEYNYWSPHLSIVPEHQAEYLSDQEALSSYLEKGSQKAIISSMEDKLRPVMLYFTVTKTGVVSNVRVESISNYPLFDKKMVELINNIPGTWKPAKDSKGQTVDQELVITFGSGGC
ncbi:TonB protein C-terminal [Formosa sp. Hel1_31_208]|uniref:energy transducer TonB n=1 Tax=Formosa sp. Hel1_31_208 TaxID=1798225 RepID=UPI000879EE1F|nr:energy transducer TonB [Formosa sp. Hel1_31_208]SDS55047.1 TonB protein C-terminal [Formosa sp. Hel1_31_208]